ncbi:Alcohol dehydrogenase, class IV [Thermanaeromonas toyohensis ToBE]|uniref:Alcohol dehydrogenase, class IV n=1 Tax=Thermanaeromonas toyohensis ToBE TaxID=698762 RepID=A0A1W1VQ32_9FIRM|nr:iron-containing alcohol dehydrogenase family protein [Thermanaeromonas toyohensis]SMB95446.1 Alcohol dehydrogenase, class IV [Thermanaeromonas toyohensis ToBE]
MDFSFFLPTRFYFGEGCLKANFHPLEELGRRALIVTGRRSARESGALEDLLEVLEHLKIKWSIFERVPPNPTLEVLAEGVKVAQEERVDLVIGCGGGSPMDVAKGIAILATNKVKATELYRTPLPEAPLPVVAIPTTAGTGSEVTPHAVFTLPEEETKKGFSDVRLFPRVAWVDPRYTYSLPEEVTIDTALDALSHAVEGYLSRRASPLTDLLATEVIRLIGSCRNALEKREFTPHIRRSLLYASSLAGMVIAQTRTTILHTLGYSLTFFRGVPHGRANGLLMAAYLEFLAPVAPQKVAHILSLLGFSGIDELGVTLKNLLPSPERYTDEELKGYAALASKAQHSLKATLRSAREDELYEILRRSLL